MAAPRLLLHLPVYAAACTGLYAGSLALVTVLQAQHNAEVIREVSPLVEALSQAEAARLAAEDAVRSASGTLGTASDRYADVAATAERVDAAMAALARQMSAVTGVVSSIRSSGRLPAAPGSVSSVAAPATQGTTGASGTVK